MPSAFNPVVYKTMQQVKQQAERDYEEHKQANPTPNNIPVLAERVELLEKLLGV